MSVIRQPSNVKLRSVSNIRNALWIDEFGAPALSTSGQGSGHTGVTQCCQIVYLDTKYVKSDGVFYAWSFCVIRYKHIGYAMKWNLSYTLTFFEVFRSFCREWTELMTKYYQLDDYLGVKSRVAVQSYIEWLCIMR